MNYGYARVSTINQYLNRQMRSPFIPGIETKFISYLGIEKMLFVLMRMPSSNEDWPLKIKK